MTEQPQSINHERTKVLVIIAIAVVPLVLAVILYFFFPGLVSGTTTNQGTLIQPPTQIPGIAADGQWVILISVQRECDNSCERVLYLSRQVYISLGKDASRVRRVIITAEDLSAEFLDLLAREHDRIQIVHAGPGVNSILQKTASGVHPMVFIMDPNGNIMMYYDAQQVGKPLRDDLKHLLKVSNIG